MKKSKHAITLQNEWVKKQIALGEVCSKCERGQPLVRLTCDHIIPLSLLAQLGIPKDEYNEENLDILCERCNSFKQSRLDFTNPKTKPLLMKYVERA